MAREFDLLLYDALRSLANGNVIYYIPDSPASPDKPLVLLWNAPSADVVFFHMLDQGWIDESDNQGDIVTFIITMNGLQARLNSESWHQRLSWWQRLAGRINIMRGKIKVPS